jgi:hypothetical protein
VASGTSGLGAMAAAREAKLVRGTDGCIDVVGIVAGTSEFGLVGFDPQAEAKESAAAHLLIGAGHPVEPVLDRGSGLLEPALPEPQFSEERGVFPGQICHASQRPLLDGREMCFRRRELAASDLDHRGREQWGKRRLRGQWGPSLCQRMVRQLDSLLPPAKLVERLDGIGQQEAVWPVACQPQSPHSVPTR